MDQITSSKCFCDKISKSTKKEMSFFNDPASISSFLERELDTVMERYNAAAKSKKKFPILRKIAYSSIPKTTNDYTKMAGQVYFYDNRVEKRQADYNKLVVSLESQNGQKNIQFAYLYIEPSKDGRKLNFGLRFSSVKMESDESTIDERYAKFYYKTHNRNPGSEIVRPKSKREEIREEHIFNHYHSGEFRYDTCVHFSIFLNKVLRDYLGISSYKEVNQQSPLGLLFENSDKSCVSDPMVRRVFFASSKVDDLDNTNLAKIQMALDQNQLVKIPESDDEDDQFDFLRNSLHKVDFNPYIVDDDSNGVQFNENLDLMTDDVNDFATTTLDFTLPDDIASTQLSSSSSESGNSESSSLDMHSTSSKITGPESRTVVGQERSTDKILEIFQSELETESKKSKFRNILNLILQNSQKNADFLIFELKKMLKSDIFRVNKLHKDYIWFKKNDEEFLMYKLQHPGNNLRAKSSSLRIEDELDYQQKLKFMTNFNQMINVVRQWDKTTKQKFGLKEKVYFEMYKDMTLYFEPLTCLKTFLVMYLANFNFVMEQGVEIRIANGDDNVTLVYKFLFNEEAHELFMSLRDTTNSRVLSQTQKNQANEMAVVEFCKIKRIDRSSVRVKINQNWTEADVDSVANKMRVII